MQYETVYQINNKKRWLNYVKDITVHDPIVTLHLLVCYQVIHHTARLEQRLLENSLSINNLEKQLIVQTNEIDKLKDKTK